MNRFEQDKEHPKLSIITPTLNQGDYIERTIQSVLGQEYPNIEYIIIDGGSTDQTLKIIDRYSDKLACCISEKDAGQSDALNKGFSKATGEIVAWINSDDWYEKETFRTVARYFASNECDVLVGNCKMVYDGEPERNFIDKPGQVSFSRLLRYWESFFCPPQPSIFFKKALLEKVGPLDQSLKYAMDLDLWIKFSKHGKFVYADELFSNYLIHKSSKSGSGDGFGKFVAEWKKVAFKHLASASLAEKFRFYRDYYSKKERHY